MAAEGHQERFPPPSLRDRYAFREGTFAGTRAKGRNAPIPAVRGPAMEPRKSTHLRAEQHVSAPRRGQRGF
jgi:hypothetical protein